MKLEDVATSEYYGSNDKTPSKGSLVEISNKLYAGRLVVIDTMSEEIIGTIPVNYNYLIECIKKGFHYSGEVTSSGMSPIPHVVVKLYA